MFLPMMLAKSIVLAGLNATISPGALQPWVDQIEQTVTEQGKFSKQAVAYLPLSPPPAFWDYKCKKCRFWLTPNSCEMVKGEISPRGWCAIWLPPDEKPPFVWIGELRRGSARRRVGNGYP